MRLFSLSMKQWLINRYRMVFAVCRSGFEAECNRRVRRYRRNSCATASRLSVSLSQLKRRANVLCCGLCGLCGPACCHSPHPIRNSFLFKLLPYSIVSLIAFARLCSGFFGTVLTLRFLGLRLRNGCETHRRLADKKQNFYGWIAQANALILINKSFNFVLTDCFQRMLEKF